MCLRPLQFFEMNYVIEFLQDSNKVGAIVVINLPFYWWRNRSTERVNNLPKFRQEVVEPGSGPRWFDFRASTVSQKKCSLCITRPPSSGDV